MSNIAGLNRTKALETPDLSRWVRLFSAQILFVCLLVSFSPFALDAKGVAASGGNIVNQLGYSALAALSLLMMVLFTDPKVVLSLFRPVWLLLFGALSRTSRIVDAITHLNQRSPRRLCVIC